MLLDRDARTMWLGNGFKYDAYPSGPREPSATVVLFKEKRRLLGARNREVWRELPSLIAERHGQDLGGALPLRNIRDEADVDIYVAALLRKQADIVDVVESVVHVPAGMRTGTRMATYRMDVLQAERLAGRLYSAVSTYYRNLGDDWTERLKREADPRRRATLRAQLVLRATQQYWTRVEKLRPFLIAHVEALGADRFEEKGEVFRREVHRAARDSYELACGQENGRQIRAFALGWARLFAPVPKGAEEGAENEAAGIDMPEPQ
jgi:CRISPR system Cascade subunit CasA